MSTPRTKEVGPRHPAIPQLTPENEHYWLGGEVGELRIRRCQRCRHWEESPTPVCPNCLGRELLSEVTTGRGFVYTFTTTYNVSYFGWSRGPTLAIPYTTVIVELDDQEALRITTNLVHCESHAIEVGLRVRAVFEPSGDLWIPLFEPETTQ